MQLSIIIVHYKTLDLTQRCLESLSASLNDEMEVIIVDNNSQDGAEKVIKTVFPSVKWITNTTNEGFGRANNVGATEAKGEFLLLLNSDMLIPEGSIEYCLEKIKKDTTIGALGCKILNEDKSVQRSRFYNVANYKDILHTNLIYDKFFQPKRGDLDAILGAFMLIPTVAFRKIKGFDPDFFMYSEELELCYRLRTGGYRIVYSKEVYVIHKHGGSTNDSKWSLKQKNVSNALLYKKTKGTAGYLLFNALFVLNSLSNFFVMWFIDENYRKGYWKQQRLYLYTLRYFFLIIFNYGKSESKHYLKVPTDT